MRKNTSSWSFKNHVKVHLTTMWRQKHWMFQMKTWFCSLNKTKHFLILKYRQKNNKVTSLRLSFGLCETDLVIKVGSAQLSPVYWYDYD